MRQDKIYSTCTYWSKSNTPVKLILLIILGIHTNVTCGRFDTGNQRSEE